MAAISRLALVLLVIDVVAFLAQGASRPARPFLAPPTTTATEGSVYNTVTVVFGRDPTHHCFLLADTPMARRVGLMGRRSLGGYTGMVFAYPADSSDSYDMRDTLLPLSIAFFTSRGTFLSSTLMTPCPAGLARCPLYSASGPFRTAIEVPAGQLPVLGVGPGTAVHVGGPCAP